MKKFVLIASYLYSIGVAAHEPMVVDPGSIAPIPFPGHDVLLLSDKDGTPSRAAILEIAIPARTFGAPPHIHSNEDEHFYVLEGNVEFLDRNETFSVSAGSLVVLPRGHLHGFWNRSEQAARMLLVITPGDMASFFDAVVADVRSKNPNSPDKMGAIIAEVANKYGVSVHPDKIPASAKSLLAK